MNKLAVLAVNQNTHFARILTREVGEGSVDFIHPSELSLPRLRGHRRLLVRTSGALRDDGDLSILKTLSSETEVLNPVSCHETFRSKSTQYHFFERHNISHLPWRDLSLQKFPTDLESLLCLSSQYLVKPRRGQGGWGIETLFPESFAKWYEQQRSKNDLDFVIQPYLCDAQEFRVFFAGDYRLVLERFPSKNVAANFASGGGAKPGQLPTEVAAEIERLIGLSLAAYGAIDLLIKDECHYVLELNVVPGIEQAEALAGRPLIPIILSLFRS